MTRSPRLFAVLAGGILLAFPALRADDEHADEGLSIARSWIAEIDAGKYEESYQDGGSALHDKVQEDLWVKILKNERPALGKVVTRQEVDHTYKPNGFEGTDGEFMTVSYHTSFANKANEVEHVILRREGGTWRGVGYDFGPQDVVTDPDVAPPTTTTTTVTNAPPVQDNPMVVPAKRPHQ